MCQKSCWGAMVPQQDTFRSFDNRSNDHAMDGVQVAGCLSVLLIIFTSLWSPLGPLTRLLLNNSAMQARRALLTLLLLTTSSSAVTARRRSKGDRCALCHHPPHHLRQQRHRQRRRPSFLQVVQQNDVSHSDTTSHHSSSSSSSSLVAVQRAMDMARILSAKVIFPILKSSITASLFQRRRRFESWDEFWSTQTLATNLAAPSSPDESSSNTAVIKKMISHAQRLTSALEELGPTYVKFGQALGSRPDIVPHSLAAALSALQDDMTPFDTDAAREIILNDITNLIVDGNRTAGDDGPTWEDLRSLSVSLSSSQPIAAASIGQVYKVTLPTLGDVAIKVRRPGVRTLVEGDAHLILSITDFLESLPQLPSLPLLPPWTRSEDGTTTTNARRNNNKQQRQQQQQKRRLINTKLTSAAREFMSRIFEELDYRNEAKNIELFASLYSSERRCKIANHGGGIVPSTATNTNNIKVIVPKVYSSWCTENILIMEWIDGTKLTNVVVNNGGEEEYNNVDDARTTTTMTKIKTNAENLALVKVAIDATLNQLLVTGVLHADPHAGNLLKVRRADGSLTLAYLDFGLVSSIPNQVRDALICAVVLQIFERNVSSVSSLFGELQLIPQYILDDKVERLALEDALRITFDNSLLYPTTTTTTTIDDVQKQQRQSNSRTQSQNSTVKDATTVSSTTMIPELKFDKLLDSLSRLIPRFEFDLPPYFINNARALSTLEGIAKSLDPTFNVLTIMYPYAINRLLSNPTQSPIVDRTVQTLIRNSVDGTIDRCKIRRLLQDSSSISGLSKRHLLWTILRTRPGRKLTRTIVREELGQYLIEPGMSRSRRRRGSRWTTNGTKAPKKNTKWYLLPL